MPTLHRLKLLATQCQTTTSTTHSPTASPVIHIRRRRHRNTLRMLLDRRHQDPPEITDKVVRVRHKLKDFFVSSPPPPLDDKRRREGDKQEQEGLLPAFPPPPSGGGFRFRTGSAFRLRGPVSSAFRLRLLRRAWRPVLLTIPE